MNDSGGMDSDGGCWGSATGEIVREEYQYGRGENILAREAARTGQQAEVQLSEKDIGQDLLGRWAVWRGGEKGEPNLGVAQEICRGAEERKNQRLNHRSVMLLSRMPVFALQVLREDGVEDPTVDMIGYAMTMIRIGMDVDQRDREHPEDQPQDRNDTKPTHVQPHRLSEIFDSHILSTYTMCITGTSFDATPVDATPSKGTDPSRSPSSHSSRLASTLKIAYRELPATSIRIIAAPNASLGVLLLGPQAHSRLFHVNTTASTILSRACVVPYSRRHHVHRRDFRRCDRSH